MKVSNLRKIIDPTTFEPSVVVDVEIPRMTLYELTLMKEYIVTGKQIGRAHV